MGIFHPPVSGDTQNGSQLLGWKILELNFGTRFSHKILEQFQMPHKILAHKRRTKNEMAHKMENQRDFFLELDVPCERKTSYLSMIFPSSHL